MPEAPIPPWEAARLAALDRLRLFGTPAEERFDRITRLAKKMLGVPIAMIDLLGEDSVWIKSAQGFDKSLAPRSTSYCSYTILSKEFLVPNAKEEPKLEGNPYTPSLQFYAGIPLKSEGMPVGAFCVCGFEPRELSDEELECLRDFADLAERELSVNHLSESQIALAAENERLSHRALVDDLTKLWNRGAVLEVLGRELRKARETDTPTGLLLLDVDYFKKINDTYGHPAGDTVLKEVSERMRSAVRPGDTVGRFGGEEFLVVLPGCGKNKIIEVAERIRDAVAMAPFESDGTLIPVTISIGATMAVEEQTEELLVRAADLGLYRAKQGGRNRVEPKWLTPSFLSLRSSSKPGASG